MAEKIAVQLTAPQGGIDNPNLSGGVYEITSGWHPYSHSLAEPMLSGTIVRNNSNKPSRVINASLLTSYSDDFYHRIHISPSQLDLGNIASTQEVTFYVWNAHFTQKRLTAIAGISEGLVLEGKKAPYDYQALEEQTYKLTVTPDGSSVIDDSIVFAFDEERPSIIITGDRIVAFAFMPNWQDGITETLEWSTDILTSESGFEQRSALYLTPRRTFEADFILHQNERQYFNNMMSWGARNWAIPLWHYIQTLNVAAQQGDNFIGCTTQDIEFSEGGLILLYRDFTTYEIAEVSAISEDGLTLKRPLQADWKKGTRLYPAKSAYFAKQPSLSRKTDNLQLASITFFIDDTNPFKGVAPEETYLGFPVFMMKPEESNDLTSQYQRLLETIDNKMALPSMFDKSTYSFLVQSYRWLGMGRTEQRQFREFIYFLNGQQKTAWIPSHADDLTVVDIVSATEPVLVIAPCGYKRFASNDADKKHLVIYLNDGTHYFRKIIDSEAIDGKERLAMDSPLGKQLQPSDIRRICYMRLCRSNSDSVEISHVTDSEGLAASQLTFKRVRDNEL
ncbi:hypothetical protein DM558_07520 [Entomomonas moraniae]|uniref:Phage tail protein n=1 Tax=Entomomonas moraniae TaxID=2213226 RepID=A0A3Q9JJ26_9GAMM|nr:hypothetical protein [Entomomonas moraniae]AZS50636.1 hypothetical protein DM558_07520 [Entomomonas moraniae]